MAIISLDNLSRSYGPRRGIEQLNLSIPEGVLYGFLGPNGAGKTTTIRVLLGLLRPTSGAANVFGLDCWGDSHRIKAELGYLPGDLRLYPWLTGATALSLFGRIRRRDMARHGRELAEEFDLDLGVRVSRMSRGMRQKLGLILALAHRPRLLILDEPTASLDPLMQIRLHDRLRKLTAAGHTVFFSSHSLAEVDDLCDRVAIVRDGRLVADEGLEALRRRAGRDVSIRWRDADGAALQAPPFLRVRERNGLLWTAALDGPVEPFIAWLAGRAVEDLTIAKPDLESLFRRYYERKSEG